MSDSSKRKTNPQKKETLTPTLVAPRRLNNDAPLKTHNNAERKSERGNAKSKETQNAKHVKHKIPKQFSY